MQYHVLSQVLCAILSANLGAAALLQYYSNITTVIFSPGAHDEVKHYSAGAQVT